MNESENYLDQLLNAVDGRSDLNDSDPVNPEEIESKEQMPQKSTRETIDIPDSNDLFMDQFEQELRKDNDPDEFLKQFEQELDRDESSQGVTKATQPMLDDIDQIMESVNQEAANDTAEMETSAVEKTAEQKEDTAEVKNDEGASEDGIDDLAIDVNAIMYHCKDSLSGINGEIRPGIVHRIDMDTTGSLIVCKNDESHVFIAEQIKEHSVNRRYRGIVYGVVRDDEGTIHAPIGRHPVDRKKMAINEKNGKDAITHYKVLERFDKYTYMEFKLETGRTHQIRVHMASIGHPLLGDTLYSNGKSPYKLQGQTLHAMTIGFIHPRTREYMEISAPLPEYFEKILRDLR